MPARRRTVVASQPASPNPQPAPARTRRPTRRSRSAALRLSLLAWALCVAVLHLYGSTSIRIRLDATLADASSILLVVAHPDDETLFFSPTIVGLRDGGRRSIGVLVLSNGDHEGVGGVREREMQLACVALGLSPCAVLDDPCALRGSRAASERSQRPARRAKARLAGIEDPAPRLRGRQGRPRDRDVQRAWRDGPREPSGH